jgi:cytochrome c oxidase subunit 2
MRALSFLRSHAVAGGVAGIAIALAAGVAGGVVHAQAPVERVIRISAKKFDFTPGEIVLKKGETVVFELTSQDRVHGFAIKAFGVHAEITPGQTTRVRFTPDRTGTFAFACDEFCGSGHEDMNGTIKVVE